MINLSEVINDPDFAETFTISRTGGRFEIGKWIETAPSVIPAYGVVTPAKPLEINQVPEGDRLTGAITVKSLIPMYVSRAGVSSGVSDLILWNGSSYKVSYVWPWEHYGYYKCIAIRVADSNG